jgi:hypothetical protein
MDIDGGCILEEFTEASTGIGKSPAGGLDPELIEGLLNFFILGFVHKTGKRVWVAGRMVARDPWDVYTLFGDLSGHKKSRPHDSQSNRCSAKSSKQFIFIVD